MSRREAVVENRHVASTRETWWDEARIVLPKELLVGFCPRPVGNRVSPTVEQISTLPPPTASRRSCLRRCRAVIDDPNLVLNGRADQDPVVKRVVVDAVHVIELRQVQPRRIVDVQTLRVVGDDSVVGEARIEVLDQVIPDMPLPDDPARRRSGRLHFDDRIGLEQSGLVGRYPACGKHLFAQPDFFRDQEDIAIRQHLEIVMNGSTGSARPLPQDRPVERQPLNSEPEVDQRAAKQRAVVVKVESSGRTGHGRPLVDGLPARVYEPNLIPAGHLIQPVPRGRSLRHSWFAKGGKYKRKQEPKAAMFLHGQSSRFVARLRTPQHSVKTGWRTSPGSAWRSLHLRSAQPTGNQDPTMAIAPSEAVSPGELAALSIHHHDRFGTALLRTIVPARLAATARPGEAGS